MAISEEDLARWEALVAAVPAGPWYQGWEYDGHQGVFARYYDAPPVLEPEGTGIEGFPPLMDIAATLEGGIREVPKPAAMELAAAATAALPALMAEVRRLQAALAALRSRGEAMLTWVDGEPDDDTYRSGVAQGLCEAWDEVADAARRVLDGAEAAP